MEGVAWSFDADLGDRAEACCELCGEPDPAGHECCECRITVFSSDIDVASVRPSIGDVVA